MRIEIQKFHCTSLSPKSVSLHIQISIKLCSNSVSKGSYRELTRSHPYIVKIDVSSSYRDRDIEQLLEMLLTFAYSIQMLRSLLEMLLTFAYSIQMLRSLVFQNLL